jgi:hypothetical protein
MGEARGSITTKPGPSGGIYGRGGDTRAYSNRGRESRGIVNQQPAPSTPTVSRRPPIPTPRVSQQPTTPSSGFSVQGTTPTPNVSQRPTGPVPGSSQPPSTPYVGSGSKQQGSVRQQPAARTPSVSFGGYRGTGEAKAQSLRGQSSRQSSEQMRPSTPPVSRSVPAGKGASGNRQRR